MQHIHIHIYPPALPQYPVYPTYPAYPLDMPYWGTYNPPYYTWCSTSTAVN